MKFKLAVPADFTVWHNTQGKPPPFSWIGRDVNGILHRFAVGHWRPVTLSQQAELNNRLETGVLTPVPSEALDQTFEISELCGALSNTSDETVVAARIESGGKAAYQIWADGYFFKSFEPSPTMTGALDALVATMTHLNLLQQFSPHSIRYLKAGPSLVSPGAKGWVREVLLELRRLEVEGELTATPAADLDRGQFARLFASRVAKPR